MSSNISDGSSSFKDLIDWFKWPLTYLKIVGSCCVVAVIAAIIYQKRKNQQIKSAKDQNNKTIDDYSYRDLFHFFINPEFHVDKLPLAKEFSERMHAEAAQYMMEDHPDNPDFPDHFTYIPYDKDKVNKRLDYIFNRLFKEKYLDWYEAGQPATSDSRYWWAQTKLHLTTYLIQRQPYHLTDGVWLRGVNQGPMSSIQAKLFAIYIDELGNGNPSQNHCNVYLDVLESLGLQVPPIYSREFVDQELILEISFKKPLLTLTTSLFPKTFEPEILGYTLWLETTAPAEHAGLRKILDRYDLNSNFSLLHTAIDNNVNGHGRYAREAVELYLDQIRETQGDQAVEEHWKRIWTGYVAYGMTGNIDNALRELYEKQKVLTPREEFIELIKKKAPTAQKMHGSRRVGPEGLFLNDMFASGDAEKLCDQLAQSELIVKGDPGASPLINHAVSFQGPMYQVFDSDELTIISRWILSLKPSTLNDMLSLILQRRKFSNKIIKDLILQLPDGSSHSLRQLIEGKPSELLAAFRASQWTIPFDGHKLTEENVDTCPLMRALARAGPLEHIFNRDGEDKQIIRQWLLDGASLLNETLQDSTSSEKNGVNILSHEGFKFQY
ncbi:unnamed protein product [Rotaria sp. Silwood2]|nr:unnamed protein product [Rotaria sp. Silwood2]CAF4349981.1 unnamed protein product [Rotaria sp. Silwood2]CAF4464763.1 unnamed protein product [Rotaria sp. Silwood2]